MKEKIETAICIALGLGWIGSIWLFLAVYMYPTGVIILFSGVIATIGAAKRNETNSTIILKAYYGLIYLLVFVSYGSPVWWFFVEGTDGNGALVLMVCFVILVFWLPLGSYALGKAVTVSTGLLHEIMILLLKEEK